MYVAFITSLICLLKLLTHPVFWLHINPQVEALFYIPLPSKNSSTYKVIINADFNLKLKEKEMVFHHIGMNSSNNKLKSFCNFFTPYQKKQMDRKPALSCGFFLWYILLVVSMIGCFFLEYMCFWNIFVVASMLTYIFKFNIF